MSSEQVETLSWFHPGCDRHTAESLLLQNGVDGTYLLRPSSKPGDYALSVRCDSSVKHYPLTWTGTNYKFGHGEFESVQDLLHHFQNKPLIGSESGQLTLLNYPYPRVIDEPNMYDTIRVHAEFSTADDYTRGPEFSINSKEGFLTKLGSTFKTWRTRWFVLQKNELRYYKHKTDKTPIRALNLDECSECQRDGSHKGKFNVFRVVFKWRTFYMYATTEQECNDWISLINWRLVRRIFTCLSVSQSINVAVFNIVCCY
ncbi:dual adapter for phosphotyrosine and 3-phosphotyrosine and 3-phosphoinositide-like isoform X1 [Crassostrea angulata]|nr:dual adapter for phosphotyrosine and 3-phosphotyrosine and 3-phosphoinositide-like isoform X1 [Crassostrea angulata]XP_052685306.1 dual adapter for phosphotyrosine and 3-phosphotyrosine and 3-phosphoinositide-like isoform X1 [Crassostrea angulata]XP_052685307.1 dual adapter for phosphotyrosine and 3-phosphotyrosine and 3-phosphoinositide-like isoform X1 [Crassostrea angulata]XP_052685308.1 dual adapter for phosphotyrosine and 3-phosphotyrosine and 3-phosphoinositide-like isoform X1 [Crassostr